MPRSPANGPRATAVRKRVPERTSEVLSGEAEVSQVRFAPTAATSPVREVFGQPVATSRELRRHELCVATAAGKELGVAAGFGDDSLLQGEDEIGVRFLTQRGHPRA